MVTVAPNPDPDELSRGLRSEALEALLEQYDGRSITVSFRDLAGPLPADERTHGMFPYPARLLRQIPRWMLDCEQIVNDVDQVVDPFCGAGTVLVEAQNRSLNAAGIEQNPIGALVSRVKTTPIDVNQFLLAARATLESAKRARGVGSPPSYLRRWYSAEAFSALARLALATGAHEGPIRDAVSLALALTVRRSANTDPRVPVPVRAKAASNTRTRDVWSIWAAEVEQMGRRLSRVPTSSTVSVVTGDSRSSAAWDAAAVGQRSLIFTSPPYGAAQKYIRSTSLELGWLGFASDRGTIELEKQNIGREHLVRSELAASRTHTFHPVVEQAVSAARAVSDVRGAIYATYFADMKAAFDQVGDRAARIVLVSGTNTVGNLELDTYSLLGNLVEDLGFTRTLSLRDEIRGRSFMTKRRSSTHPTRAEYVEIFERSGPSDRAT